MKENNMSVIAEELQNLVMTDEEFAKALITANDAAAVRKLLHEHGMELSVEEVEAAFAKGSAEIRKCLSEENSELTEDQLDDVAGGGWRKGMCRLLASCVVGAGFGALCGFCPGAAAATKYVAIGLGVWTTAGFLA